MSCFCQSNRKCDECNEREKRLVWEEVEQVEAGNGVGMICKVLNFGNRKKVVGFFLDKNVYYGPCPTLCKKAHCQQLVGHLEVPFKNVFFWPCPTWCKIARCQQPWRKELPCQNKVALNGKSGMTSPVAVIDLHQ